MKDTETRMIPVYDVNHVQTDAMSKLSRKPELCNRGSARQRSRSSFAAPTTYSRVNFRNITQPLRASLTNL